jgi:hypothetical protein
MDPKHIGLRSTNFNYMKQALRSGHAQSCRMLSASVASRQKKGLFPLSLVMVTIVAMLMEVPASFG